MANILSMKVVYIEGARVTIDTSNGIEIIVSLKNDKIFEFKQFSNGIYYFETAFQYIIDKPKQQFIDYSMLQTIETNKT